MKIVEVERRTSDEYAASSDSLRHFSIARVRAPPFVFVLAVECYYVEAARESRRTDVHDGIVQPMVLINGSTEGLELVRDIGRERGSRLDAI